MARLWWRHILLGGATVGLLLAPAVASPRGAPGLCALAALLLLAVRVRADGPPGPTWIVLATATAALTGLAAGGARIEAHAAGAGSGVAGERVSATGVLTAAPRISGNRLRAPLQTPGGTYLLVLPSGTAEPAAGDAVRVAGELAAPEPWREAELSRLGARLELRGHRIVVPGPGRGGIAGFLDRVRGRAERGIASGLGPGQAALARGFVLGQDDRIEPTTREHFKRSGLAHLLAVSGQNVMLLAILAGLLLGLAGLRPRARIGVTILLILVYVPVAGAGPSIQRAGVMGVAGLLATLAGRPADRAWLPLLAAACTLLLNPLAAGDVGWQLSFAAVIGIALWAAPLRRLLLPWLVRPWRSAGHGRGLRLPESVARPLAEGAALTIAATLATAPLMAHHFGSFPLASLPANLLVLPAVAPVMWLGMIASLLGQVPILPTAPLALVAGPLLDLIAAVASALGSPSWALSEIALPSPAHVAAIYAVLLAGMAALLRALARRRGLSSPLRRITTPLTGAGLLAAVLLAGDVVPTRSGADGHAPPAAGTLRITALDIGQGDALLLEQRRGAPVLVDTGPPGGGIGEALRERGIERLAALILTHAELDHSGALAEVVATAPAERVIGPAGRLPEPDPAAALPPDATRLAGGDTVRLGRLRLEVLWPLPQAEVSDPNHASLVLRVRFGRWTSLLSGDAEQEVTGLDPGPVDVLKVSHHGSTDSGLPTLLARSRPPIALISAGAGNRHGHPTPDTLAALAAAGVCVLRTDLGGDLAVELGPAGLRAEAERTDVSCAAP